MCYPRLVRWSALLLVIFVGCSTEYDVRIRASDDLLEGAAQAEVAIVSNCLSQSVAGPIQGDPYLRYALSSAAPALGRVPEGNHGLFARFTDSACNVVAAGCQDVEIEDGGDATLAVEMVAASGFACDATEQCVGGQCMVGVPVDASMEDAAMADSGPRDSGQTDAHADAPVADAGGDAGSVDASVVDAGPGDTGVDAGGPCATGFLCDDFEGSAFDYDINVDKGSTVELSRAEAHSGSQSVLIHAVAGTVAATFSVRPSMSIETGDQWVRAWYRLPETFVGISPFAFESTDNAVTIYTTGEDYTGLDTFRFPGDQTSVESRRVLPTGEWTCVEMHINFDGQPSVELFIEGEAAAEMEVPIPNAFPEVRFGANYRDEADPVDYDFYIDDIAVGLERLGCAEL